MSEMSSADIHALVDEIASRIGFTKALPEKAYTNSQIVATIASFAVSDGRAALRDYFTTLTAPDSLDDINLPELTLTQLGMRLGGTD